MARGQGRRDVRYIEFMGKDNVPFHTLSFPATILGANLDGTERWKLVDYIKSFNYLNYEGGKFSTSEGRGVFMDQALDILPADYWRWWLLSNIPESSDSNFTWESFQAGVNKDLADVLGNFVSRVTKFAAARFGPTIPAAGAYGPAEAAVTADLARRLAAYEAAMEAIELRKAAQELRALWVVGNEYLQSAAPWTAIKTDPDRAAAITRFAFNLIRLYAVLSRPFLPDASDDHARRPPPRRRRLADRPRRRARGPPRRPPLHRARGALRQARRRPHRRALRPLRRRRVTAALVPELAVTDCAASLRFYRDLLGFAVRYQRPEEGFAYLALGDAELMLDEIGGAAPSPTATRPAPVPSAAASTCSRVPALAPLLAALRRNRTPLLLEPEEKWYRRHDWIGQRQFVVADPDGYLLRFCEPLGERPASP